VFARAIQQSAVLLAAFVVNSYAAQQENVLLLAALLQKDFWGNMIHKV